jgi:RNA polymerase sigma-70 factor (ECF subfamily)
MSTERTEQFFGLFMANENRVYAYIMSLVGNASDADDIMQETAAVLWEKFDVFELGTSFIAWAMQIAHYKVLAHRKTCQRSKVMFNSNLFDVLVQHATPAVNEVDGRLESLRTCLASLKEADRELLELHYDYTKTIKSIAEDAGRSVQGLYKVMARIHNQLLRCVRRRLTIEAIE